jgi:hypothetical protein
MKRIARIAGGALLAIGSSVMAQDTAKCVLRGALAARQNQPLYIVNGQIFADSTPLVANTGAGFLARGPGQFFGITGYRCPACQDKREPGKPVEFSFLAEPVVVSVNNATPVKPGDVIEAVNDQPITTSAGSTQFTYPPVGPNTLTVRRGRDRIVLRFDFTVPPPCPFSPGDKVFHVLSGIDSSRVVYSGLRVLGGAPSMTVRDTTRPAPIYVIDGVRIEPFSVPAATRYGFAVSCQSGCTKVTNPDGTTFYRYTGPPMINAIRDTSLAANAGLRVGDAIVKVDGFSILSDDAAIRLAQSEPKSSPLRVTVLRDGREIGVVLHAPK